MNLITAGETLRRSSSDKRYMLEMASVPDRCSENAPTFLSAFQSAVIAIPNMSNDFIYLQEEEGCSSSAVFPLIKFPPG